MPEQPPVRRGRRSDQLAAAMEGDADISLRDTATAAQLVHEHDDAGEIIAELPLLTENGIITKAATAHITFEYGVDFYAKSAATDGRHHGESPEDAANRLIYATNTEVLDQIADFDERMQAFLAERNERRSRVQGL